MIGYILFLIFWIVFGALYLTRDKSKDNEKVANFH